MTSSSETNEQVRFEIASLRAMLNIDDGVATDTLVYPFGTFACAGNAADIDILIVVNTPDNSGSEYGPEMNQIAQRARGDWSVEAPVDYATHEQQRLAEQWAQRTHIPCVFAFGPENSQFRFEGTKYYHVNGPVTRSMWKSFCRFFPVHAHTIRHIGASEVQPIPVPIPLRSTDLASYSATLRARLKRGESSSRLIKKSLQTIALLRTEAHIDQFLANSSYSEALSTIPDLRILTGRSSATLRDEWTIDEALNLLEAASSQLAYSGMDILLASR